jgi:dihydrofolate reductase
VKKPPRLVLVAAVAENGVIGRDGDMPWRLPGDLKHFKALTLGKPVIMGRRTFDSIGRKPLPGRPNIVMTRDKNFRANGVAVVADLEEALRLAEKEAARLSVDEIAVIGGSTLYAEALPRADRLYLTEVHAKPEGTVRFPDFDRSAWREVSREGPQREPGEAHTYTFVTLERIS